MYSAVIVDDELDSQLVLKKILKEHCPDVEVRSCYFSVSESVPCILESPPDILLLDMNLKDGTGFDILNQIGSVDTRVILITAFDEFAIKAFEFQVDNYLLKPLKPKALHAAMQESIRLIENRNELEELKLTRERSISRKIGIPAKDTLMILDLNDIVRFEANRNYTYVYLENKDKILIPKTIKKISEVLESKGFIRIHQSHLINIQFIQLLDRKANLINLSNNEIVPVSRNYKSSVTNAFKFV